MFSGYVEEYILRNRGISIGKIVTVKPGSEVFIFDDAKRDWFYIGTTIDETPIVIKNIIPGYDEVYTPKVVHNQKIAWLDTQGIYHAVDINCIKEAQ